MKIVDIYSHQHAWEYLKVHKESLWNEIESAIKSIDASACRKKISKEKRMLGKVLYSPKHLNKAMHEKFSAKGWKESKTSYWVTTDAQLIRKTMQMPPFDQRIEIERSGKVAIPSHNQTDFVKDRVAVEIQFGKYAFVAFDLFVKHMAFYVGNVIDIGVEVLPMKSLQSEMSSGIAYYERELYNVVRQGRGVPAVPLILVGVAP